MAVAGEPDDPDGEVVIHLRAHFLIDGVLDLLGVRHPQAVRRNPQLGQIGPVIGKDLMEATALARDVVPAHVGRTLEGGRERGTGVRVQILTKYTASNAETALEESGADASPGSPQARPEKSGNFERLEGRVMAES